jgi:hypothetical protein
MAGQYGSALYLCWAAGTTGGTVVLNGDYRTFTYTPSVQLVEDTAGTDQANTYMPGIRSGQATFSGLLQAGSWASWGTAFKEGYIGTLIKAEEGTAVGKLIGTIPAICQGAVNSMAYNDMVSVSISWQQNGLRTEGTT